MTSATKTRLITLGILALSGVFVWLVDSGSQPNAQQISPPLILLAIMITLGLFLTLATKHNRQKESRRALTTALLLGLAAVIVVALRWVDGTLALYGVAATVALYDAHLVRISQSQSHRPS